jgi:PIN domain nuclease of toxin-antitoxin system
MSQAAIRAIEAADRLVVPDIVCLEVAHLAHVGRLRLEGSTRRWLDLALAEPSTELAVITPEIAVAAASLHQRLGDPADAIITATAMRLEFPLVTRDSRIADLGLVETIW